MANADELRYFYDFKEKKNYDACGLSKNSLSLNIICQNGWYEEFRFSSFDDAFDFLIHVKFFIWYDNSERMHEAIISEKLNPSQYIDLDRYRVRVKKIQKGS